MRNYCRYKPVAQVVDNGLADHAYIYTYTYTYTYTHTHTYTYAYTYAYSYAHRLYAYAPRQTRIQKPSASPRRCFTVVLVMPLNNLSLAWKNKGTYLKVVIVRHRNPCQPTLRYGGPALLNPPT